VPPAHGAPTRNCDLAKSISNYAAPQRPVTSASPAAFVAATRCDLINQPEARLIGIVHVGGSALIVQDLPVKPQ